VGNEAVRGTWYVVVRGGRFEPSALCVMAHCGVPTGHWPQATCRFQKPLPGPPQGDVVLQQPSRGLMARHGTRLAGAQHPWPGTRLHFFIDLIPALRMRLALPVENGGSMQGAHLTHDYHQLTSHRLRATGHMPPFSIPRTRPAGPAEIRGPCHTKRQDFVAVIPVRHNLRATAHPATITTYHAPIGRTRGSAPTARYNNALQTVSRMP